MIAEALTIARAWWKLVPGFVLGALIAFPLGQCSGDARATKRHEAANAAAQVQALTEDARAKETAAAERMNDAADVAAMKERLSDAVATLPDDVPSPRRVALGCQRLREAGTGDADLPSVCRPAGQAQARPAP
jgi:hypothetical protein